MPRLDSPADHRLQTQAIIKAGEILKALNPSALGTLLLVEEDETRNQGEIAAAIGCARSTVSKYLQSLEGLPLALVSKRGQQYSVTDSGEKVIGLIDAASDRLGVDFQAVDWTDDEEKATVADVLAPLHDSRSVTPFLVLHAVSEQDGGENLLNTPRPIWIEDIARDVNVRQEKRGESATTEQVRQTLRRFEGANTVAFKGNRITLTNKGQEQARLLRQLAQLLDEQQNTEAAAAERDESSGSSVSNHYPEARSTFGWNPASDRHSGLAQQVAPRAFRGGDRPTTSMATENRRQKPVVAPVHCLVAPETGSVEMKAQSQSRPQPLLPITSVTAGDLLKKAERIAEEHGEDARLEPYWMLDTGAKMHPLHPARLPLDQASHQAWSLINEAYRLWSAGGHSDTHNDRTRDDRPQDSP